MMSRRITLAIAAAILAVVLVGIVIFALTTNEPTLVSATDLSATATTTNDPDPVSEAPTVQPASADGAAIYATQCASCHGTSGQGGSGGPVDDLEMTLAEVIDITTNGAPRMPAYVDTLTRDQIEAAAEYSLKLSDS